MVPLAGSLALIPFVESVGDDELRPETDFSSGTTLIARSRVPMRAAPPSGSSADLGVVEWVERRDRLKITGSYILVEHSTSGVPGIWWPVRSLRTGNMGYLLDSVLEEDRRA